MVGPAPRVASDGLAGGSRSSEVERPEFGESQDSDLVASETCSPSVAVLPLPRDGAVKRLVRLTAATRLSSDEISDHTAAAPVRAFWSRQATRLTAGGRQNAGMSCRRTEGWVRRRPSRTRGLQRCPGGTVTPGLLRRRWRRAGRRRWRGSRALRWCSRWPARPSPAVLAAGSSGRRSRSDTSLACCAKRGR